MSLKILNEIRVICERLQALEQRVAELEALAKELETLTGIVEVPAKKQAANA